MPERYLVLACLIGFGGEFCKQVTLVMQPYHVDSSMSQRGQFYVIT